MELLEKNLNNDKKITQKDAKEITKTANINENKNPPISKDKKLNIEINGPSMDRLLKQEKIKQNKEKAKEIEKNAHLNSTSNINVKNKKTEKKININNNFNINKTNDNNHSKSNLDKKVIQINKGANNNPIKINPKIQNKWSKAKFGTLEDNEAKEYKSPPAELNNKPTQKRRATSLTKNKNIFRNKKIDLNNKNNSKKIENEQDILLNYMNKEIKERELYNKKLNEYNNELAKLDKEKEKLKKLKEDYENSSINLQKEKALYNMQKEEEKRTFDSFIEEEMKLINKEKKQLSVEQKNLNDLRVKYQMHNKLENKKGKNEIENIKSKINEKQKEINRKDNNDKILIDKYKKQLEEANAQIEELNMLINTLKEKNANQNLNIKNNMVKENNYTTNEYDLIFPEKYHGINYNLIKSEKTKDGKTLNFYDNNKKEIIFKNGVKKEIYNDEYQIIYFNNGDIKQIYTNQNKQIYFFKEKNIVQTTIGDECQIFKYENGQIEKKFKDGTLQIIFPDGKIKNILPDGYEEIINVNEET